MSAIEICETLPGLINKLKDEVQIKLDKKEVREKLNNEIEKNKLFAIIWEIEDVLNYISDIKKDSRDINHNVNLYITKVRSVKRKLRKLYNMIYDGSFFTSESKYELANVYINVVETLEEGIPSYDVYLLNPRYINRYDSRYIRDDGFIEDREYSFLEDIFVQKKQKFIATLADGNNTPLKVLFSTAGSSIALVNGYKSNEGESSGKYPKIDAYGIYNEEYSHFDNFNRLNYNSVAIGCIDKIICTSAAFDVVDMTYYDDCYYNLIDYDGKKSTETGIKCLERNLRYVKDNGYLLITMPRSRMNRKFLSILANSGDIIATYGIEKDDIEHIMIVFQKECFSSDMTGIKYRGYRKMFHNDCYFNFICGLEELLPLEEESMNRFYGTNTRKIIIFRGDKPDTEMFLKLMKNSNAFDPRTEDFDISPTPLLPLTRGQVGQILVSGNLDGIIDEGNGYKHIIKGRITSDTMKLPAEYTSMNDIEEYKNLDCYSKKTVEYKSNTVHVTILTPDGEVKYL